MSITIYPFTRQHKGGFNNNEIMENKPVQLSNDTEKLQPYSNLFYWAHAWSDNGSTIGEHPHKAFEIMSFVTKGWIEHYDSKNRDWKRLEEGAVQIIRAGKGISHAEKLGPGAEMFQIWVDPGLESTITKV
jgi:quercetin 2,3-dioxygenase